MRTGQGPHSSGDDPKTGHANFSKDLWWVAGNLVFLSWLWGVRPVAMSVRSVFLWVSCAVVSWVVGFALTVLGSCFSGSGPLLRRAPTRELAVHNVSWAPTQRTAT